MNYTFYLTTNCNFSCSYCYENYATKNAMTKEIAKRSIDYICENENSDKVLLSFMGGEPLLEKELMYWIIEYLESKEKFKYIDYSITTNCSLFDEKSIRIIKDKNIHVKCSIDGDELTQDLNRKTKSGKDSYGVILDNIKDILNNNIDYSIRMTIDNNTLKYMYKNIKFFTDMNLNIISSIFNVNMEFNDGEVIELQNQLKKIKDLYLKKINEGSKFTLSQIDGKFINVLADFGNHFTMCDAGVSNYKILPNGDLYPCGFLTHDSKYKIGSVFEQKDYQKGRKLAYSLVDDTYIGCEGCYARNFCLGMKCGYMNYINTGNINIPSNSTCIIEKSFFDIVISILEYMSTDKDLYYKHIYPYLDFIVSSELKLSEFGEKIYDAYEK